MVDYSASTVMDVQVVVDVLVASLVDHLLLVVVSCVAHCHDVCRVCHVWVHVNCSIVIGDGHHVQQVHVCDDRAMVDVWKRMCVSCCSVL
jgi:hypothetical protein